MIRVASAFGDRFIVDQARSLGHTIGGQMAVKGSKRYLAADGHVCILLRLDGEQAEEYRRQAHRFHPLTVRVLPLLGDEDNDQ